MAIAFDTRINGFDFNGTGTTLTVAYTVASGGALLVYPQATDGRDCTGVTYNGVAMTLVQTILAPLSENQETRCFALANAGDGASHNIVATYAGAAGPLFRLEAISYTGAHAVTASLIGANAATDFGDSETATFDLAMSTGDLAVMHACSSPAGETWTPGSGVTERQDGSSATFNAIYFVGEKSGTGTVTISATATGFSGIVNGIAVVLKPASEESVGSGSSRGRIYTYYGLH